MINREITYERDVSKSYMKIPAVREVCMDEKLMFRKEYQGFLPMEKCYVNGCGQYWYNISGRQALDAYCRIHTMDQSFFEALILRICSQLELMEWNLIDNRCLVVDPELIFVDHSGENIAFVLYPDTKGDFWEEFRQLMEYLLTKLNHSDKEGVRRVYGIYQRVVSGECNPADLKQMILSQRETPTEVAQEEVYIKKEEHFSADTEIEIGKKLNELFEEIKRRLSFKKENKETIPMVVHPEDCEEEEESVIHPTVCLAATLGKPKGVLIYEGMGDYPNFELEQEACVLGKNPRVKLYINRETISQFHAKFGYCEKDYYVEDMNSTNGTFVNDQMLNYKEKRILSPGDILCFADVKYRFL